MEHIAAKRLERVEQHTSNILQDGSSVLGIFWTAMLNLFFQRCLILFIGITANDNCVIVDVGEIEYRRGVLLVQWLSSLCTATNLATILSKPSME
eukprot:522192-Ditylum_brightwellii.AAC.1